MYRILEECPPSQNIPGVDWAHGGQVTDTNGLRWTIITDNFKYHPEICAFFVMENVWNGPEDKTKHHWTTRTSISDAENNTVTGMADGWDDLFVGPYESEKTDLRKNTVSGLYAEVEIEGYLDGNKIELGFQVGTMGLMLIRTMRVRRRGVRWGIGCITLLERRIRMTSIGTAMTHVGCTASSLVTLLSTIKPIQAEASDWIARFLRASA
jgi:hypothetical protein